MISIIIPTYNRIKKLEECLKSIRDNSYYGNEIIVLTPIIENRIKEICKKHDAILVEDGSRTGTARAMSLWAIINKGIVLSKNKYTCWLNDDCTVLKDWDRYVIKYFTGEVGIVVLKTKGIGGSDEFRTIKCGFDIECCNYAVVNKELGIRFDERFSWFYGDADIGIQSEIIYRKKTIPTTEDVLIHNHVLDNNRQINESDPRAKLDEKLYLHKWGLYVKVGETYYNTRWKFIKKVITKYIDNVLFLPEAS